MKKSISYGIAALMAAAVFSGCGKMPQAEIDRANAAIDSARIAGADLYVPDAYNALVDSMNATMVLTEGQNSKLFKNYSVTLEKLNIITQDARQAVKDAEVRKAELRVEIQNTISVVTALLDEDRQLLAKAPRGKEGTAALQAIKNEIGVIEASVSEIEGLFGKGELLDCQNRAAAAREKAAAIKAELSGVIEKYNRARR
jgi:hypothetical protein